MAGINYLRGEPRIDKSPWADSAFVFYIGWGLGLLARVPGLPLHGNTDQDGFLRWGDGVLTLGLGGGYQGEYLPLAYAIFAICTAIARDFPAYTWFTFKASNLLFEFGILWVLLRMAPPAGRKYVLALYWLNPFFILQGAYQGYWDGPTTFFALLAVWSLERRRGDKGWFLAGLALAAAVMLKPQGLFHFGLGLGGCLFFLVVFSDRWRSLGAFAAGAGFVIAPVLAALSLSGGSPLNILFGYGSVVDFMPNLCNESLNIWRTISRLLQGILGQGGPTYALVLSPWVSGAGHALGILASLMLILAFAWKIYRAQWGGGLCPGTAERNLRWMLRLCGAGLVLVFLGGLWRQSAPEAHSWMIVSRYSLKYAIILGGLLGLGALTLLLSRPLGRLLARRGVDRFARGPRTRAGQGAERQRGFLLAAAFAALVVPQIATRAHLNHIHGALVLLIPLLADRKVAALWLAMAAIHTYGYLVSGQLGLSDPMPLRFSWPIPIHPPAAAIGHWQEGMNLWLRSHLSAEPLLSILAAIQFLAVVLMIKRLFKSLGAMDGKARGESLAVSEGGFENCPT